MKETRLFGRLMSQFFSNEFSHAIFIIEETVFRAAIFCVDVKSPQGKTKTKVLCQR